MINGNLVFPKKPSPFVVAITLWKTKLNVKIIVINEKPNRFLKNEKNYV